MPDRRRATRRGSRARLRPLVGLEATDASREESFGAWRRFLEALAEQRPTVLVFEDLHWAGDDLLDFVGRARRLGDRRAAARRRDGATGAARPAPGLGRRQAQRPHGVARAARRRGDGPADRRGPRPSPVAGRDAAGAAGARQAATRSTPSSSRGCSPSVAGSARALPDSVQAIIAARLDSLPAGREGSCCSTQRSLGRTFWARGAQRGHEKARRAPALAPAARSSCGRERRSTVEGEDEFSFAHLLVRDVAYGADPASAARRQARTRGAVDRDAQRPLGGHLGAARLSLPRGARARGGRRAGQRPTSRSRRSRRSSRPTSGRLRFRRWRRRQRYATSLLGPPGRGRSEAATGRCSSSRGSGVRQGVRRTASRHGAAGGRGVPGAGRPGVRRGGRGAVPRPGCGTRAAGTTRTSVGARAGAACADGLPSPARGGRVDRAGPPADARRAAHRVDGGWASRASSSPSDSGTSRSRLARSSRSARRETRKRTSPGHRDRGPAATPSGVHARPEQPRRGA